MTTSKPLSKNARRKRRRAAYHAAINALSRDPEDPQAIAALGDLMQQYCRMVDRRIDGIGAISDETCGRDEWSFIRDLLQQIDDNGWVALYTPEGRIQVRADMGDYIERRRGSGSDHGHAHASAAEYLHERAVAQIRPHHV